MRSAMMAKVRGRDTGPELRVRKALHAAGLRFRLHRRDLPGKPDIVLPRLRSVVFVHGCFWHGHDCRRGRRPTSNQAFWDAKLARNVERDSAAAEALKAAGWNIHVLWECELAHTIDALIEALASRAKRQSESEPTR